MRESPEVVKRSSVALRAEFRTAHWAASASRAALVLSVVGSAVSRPPAGLDADCDTFARMLHTVQVALS